MEVDGGLEVLDVSEPVGHALDLLNLAVESLARRGGHRMLIVGHGVGDVLANRLGGLAHWLQSAVHGPEVPPLPELPT